MRTRLIALAGLLASSALLSGCVDPSAFSRDDGADSDVSAEPSEAELEVASAAELEKPTTEEGQAWDPRFRNGCELIIRTIWAETDRGRYIIEAESKTEECEDPELSIAIRAPNRRVVYRANYKASEVYGFTEVKTPTEIRGALIDWATNYGSLTKRSGRLPYWPAGALGPSAGAKFPFIPNPELDRVTYLEIRSADLPVYCHVMDLESMNCMLLNDLEQEVVPLGVQKFPTRDDGASANG